MPSFKVSVPAVADAKLWKIIAPNGKLFARDASDQNI